MNTPVFLHHDQASLDRAYDQSVWCPDADAVMARYLAAGDAARARLPHRSFTYGPHPQECLDWFHVEQLGAPVHVFVHGGGWMSMSKEHGTLQAPMLVSAGVHFVCIEFPMIPEMRLPEMVDSVRRALFHVERLAHDLGADAARITASGHSSGAQLLAAALGAPDRPTPPVRAAALLSGMYDLVPVMRSARRHHLQLTDDEIARLSPIRHATRLPCPLLLTAATHESPEFVRQTCAYASALQAADHPHRVRMVDDRNHYTILEDLGDAGRPLGAAILAMAQSSSIPGA